MKKAPPGITGQGSKLFIYIRRGYRLAAPPSTGC